MLFLRAVPAVLSFFGSSFASPTRIDTCATKRQQATSATVDLGYARYQGSALQAGVNQFLGIQYATPPLGDLRWRAPQGPPVKRKLQQADAFKPTCIGYFGPGLSNNVSEDCLYLDVFAPSDATTHSKLPVWFFIQGGGYAGNTDENFNFTEVIVKSNHSMVAVQLNYRVGAFGFLASEDVRQNGDLNVGLLDQKKFVTEVLQRK
jgi:carboxylesterase type B